VIPATPEPGSAGDPIEDASAEPADRPLHGPVTVVVERRARPGCEAAFEAWVADVTAAAAAFPGHLGATWLRPAAPGGAYRVVFRFASPGVLARWEGSEERRAWYARGAALAADTPRAQVITGLEGWFTLAAQGPVVPPPRYKMALVSWLAVYPLITAIQWALGPALGRLPLPLRTLALTAAMITLMTYVLMPRVTRMFARWLYPTGVPPRELRHQSTARQVE
jgi:antibiotic biosynthesis monooxygenase (ABM) superfamily enzyme